MRFWCFARVLNSTDGDAMIAPKRNISDEIYVRDITLRDYFAIRAPICQIDIEAEMSLDRSRNPHNENHKPKIRSILEIRCELSYKYADQMLKARGES